MPIPDAAVVRQRGSGQSTAGREGVDQVRDRTQAGAGGVVVRRRELLGHRGVTGHGPETRKSAGEVVVRASRIIVAPLEGQRRVGQRPRVDRDPHRSARHISALAEAAAE